jgi:Flp pilus assembly pilin Flp
MEIEKSTRREEGQTLTEYALILAFVSVMGLALVPIGPWLVARLSQVAGAL